MRRHVVLKFTNGDRDEFLLSDADLVTLRRHYRVVHEVEAHNRDIARYSTIELAATLSWDNEWMARFTGGRR